MDYFVWVARNADRTVLIDCGFNERSGARRRRTMLCPPVEALRQIDVDAAEVSQLIVTHAHYDHIGNLLSFPAARVVVTDREFAFWTSPLSRKPLFMASAEEADIDALRQLAEAGRVDFVSGRARVAPGIEVVEIGGHTPGQLAVVIATARGETVIASDALGEAAVAAWAAAAEDLPPAADHTEIARWLADRQYHQSTEPGQDYRRD